MGDDGEPPANREETIPHKDVYIKSLITPDRRRGVNARFNPSIWPEKIPGKGYPVLTRTQKNIGDSGTGISETVLGYLTSELELSDYQKVILSKDGKYAKFGYEDTRILKHEGVYYLTSIANDGINPRVVQHRSTDLENFEYDGVVGPQILLERAIQIVGKKSYYGQVWKRHLASSKLEREVQLLPIKDSSKVFVPKKGGGYAPGQIIRAEPNIQLIVGESEEDFKRNDFYENAIKNLKEDTILTKERHQTKIGIGGPPKKVNGKYIGTYHSVTESKQGDIDILEYSGSFYEFDPQKRKIVSRIRTPLIKPSGEYTLVERDINGKIKCIKFVAFPSSIIPRIETDDLFVYMGYGDKVTDVYVTSIKWVCDELDKEHNRENLLDFSKANR